MGWATKFESHSLTLHPFEFHMAKWTRSHLVELLGYYDYVSPPQVLLTSAQGHDLAAVTLHEQAHEWLGTRSNVGLLIKLLAQHEAEFEWDQDDESLLDCLFEECTLVQEGFATFVEYRALHKAPPVSEFRRQLKSREKCYLEGFDLALRIASLASAATFPELSLENLEFVQHCLLLDICRFSMNVPFPEEDDGAISLRAYYQQNSPNQRFSTILNSLEADDGIRSRFLDGAQNAISEWLAKSANKFASGLHTGITYADNVESLIAELFPQLPYEDFLAMVGRFQTSTPTVPVVELAEDYLTRELRVEFAFDTHAPLSFNPLLTAADLRAGFELVGQQRDRGIYLSFVQGEQDASRMVHWGLEIPIPSGSVCVLLHEAVISTDGNGTRWWKYVSEATACFIPCEAVPHVLKAAAGRNIVVVVDCLVNNPDSLQFALEADRYKSPVLIKTTPMGSASGLFKVMTNPQLLSDGADVFVMRNWQHFQGTNDQIHIVWVVPQARGGRTAIAMFATEPLLYILATWREHARMPKGLSFLDGPAPVWVAEEDADACDTWYLGRPDTRIIAPHNSDFATSHILTFGW